MPEKIESHEIDQWVFNESTVDGVLETLMEKGIKVNGGQTLREDRHLCAEPKTRSFHR